MIPESSALSPRTLIEAFLPLAGPTSLGVVYDTATAVGIDHHPLRLALRRMTAAGETEVSGRGRRAVARLTEVGRERLDRDRLGLRLALAQDEGTVTWDGRWRLLAVSTPEAHRRERDALRRELTEAGAAKVSTGLFITPNDLGRMLTPSHWTTLVRAVAEQVDLGGVTDPLEITEMLWPAEPVLAGYRNLAHILEEVDGTATLTPAEALVTQLRLAEALEQALRPDPLIPAVLRQGPWPATAVRQSWRSCWTSLASRTDGAGLYQGWLP